MIYNKNNKMKKSSFLLKENKIERYILLGLSIIGIIIGVLVLIGKLNLSSNVIENQKAFSTILISISVISMILSMRSSRKSKQTSFLTLFAKEIENNNYKTNIVLNHGIDANLIDAQLFLDGIYIGIEYSHGIYAEVLADENGLLFSIEYTDSFFEKYEFEDELIVSEKEEQYDENTTYENIYTKLVEFYKENENAINEFINKYLN